MKRKLSIEIGVNNDNNELYETVDNGIMKTVFRAKTMEELEEKEKEFLDDFKKKLSIRNKFSMIKNAAAKAELDKSWVGPVTKYERSKDNEKVFQQNQKDSIEAAMMMVNDDDFDSDYEDDNDDDNEKVIEMFFKIYIHTGSYFCK